MTKTEHAIRAFETGCDCNQAVIAGFERELHINPDELHRMIHSESIALGTPHANCGVVLGAASVIRMCDKCQNGAADPEALIGEFKSRFLREHHTLRCKDLLGYDLTDPVEQNTVVEEGLCESRCEGLIAEAIAIVEELIR